MNSLKRLEYCSGFTVEISAPACNTEIIQVQLLGPHQQAALGQAWVFRSLWISTRAEYNPLDWSGGSYVSELPRPPPLIPNPRDAPTKVEASGGEVAERLLISVGAIVWRRGA